MRKISQTRRLIDKSVSAIVSRMGTYDTDFEPLGGAELNVEFRTDDDPYRMVELVDVYIASDKERRYSNIEDMIRERLKEAASDVNREMEADYVERLTTRGRRNYYADIA